MNENKHFLDIIWKNGQKKEVNDSEQIAEEKNTPLNEMSKVVFDLTLPISQMERMLQETLNGNNPIENLSSWILFANSMNNTLKHPSFEGGTRGKLDDLTRCAQMAHSFHNRNEKEITKEELEQALTIFSRSAEKFIHEIKKVHEKNKNQSSGKTT